MANFQLFASELTEFLDVERINSTASDGQTNRDRFERPVTFTHKTQARWRPIDVYPKDSFSELLIKLRGHPEDAHHALSGL